MNKDNLRLKPIAVGSLPHNNVIDAMMLVEKYFSEIPFLPQLKNISIKEDMIIQFTEGMILNQYDAILDIYAGEELLSLLEQFYAEYQDILSNINSKKMDKYSISEEFCHSLPFFEKYVERVKPDYAKIQIAAPYTFLSSLVKEKYGDLSISDYIVRFLSLKVLWMIGRIKNANNKTVPIVFFDEPLASKLYGNEVETDETIKNIKYISDVIRKNGGISAFHCCGKFNWNIPIKARVNIIHFDAYSFCDEFAVYYNEIYEFLSNGGKIAWGIVPTFGDCENIPADKLIDKFYKCVNNLTKYGIDEKLIIDNSLISSSCGVGAISIGQAECTMKMVNKLSKELRKIY